MENVKGDNITKQNTLEKIENNMSLINSLPVEQRKELLSQFITLEKN